MKITRDLITKVDSDDMWGLMCDFPNHWKEVMKLTEDIELSVDSEKVKNICFAGMGGSAIGADLTRAYSLKSCPYPVQVNRHYEVPNYINENSLFIACSFSGNTEETLSALGSALEEGAQIVSELNQNPTEMLGHITTSYFSPNLNKSIALGVVKGGKKMLGKKLIIPMENKNINVTVANPVFYDENNERLNA